MAKCIAYAHKNITYMYCIILYSSWLLTTSVIYYNFNPLLMTAMHFCNLSLHFGNSLYIIKNVKKLFSNNYK